jgi:hypothetical protein
MKNEKRVFFLFLLVGTWVSCSQWESEKTKNQEIPTGLAYADHCRFFIGDETIKLLTDLNENKSENYLEATIYTNQNLKKNWQAKLHDKSLGDPFILNTELREVYPVSAQGLIELTFQVQTRDKKNPSNNKDYAVLLEKSVSVKLEDYQNEWLPLKEGERNFDYYDEYITLGMHNRKVSLSQNLYRLCPQKRLNDIAQDIEERLLRNQALANANSNQVLHNQIQKNQNVEWSFITDQTSEVPDSASLIFVKNGLELLPRQQEQLTTFKSLAMKDFTLYYGTEFTMEKPQNYFVTFKSPTGSFKFLTRKFWQEFSQLSMEQRPSFMSKVFHQLSSPVVIWNSPYQDWSALNSQMISLFYYYGYFLDSNKMSTAVDREPAYTQINHGSLWVFPAKDRSILAFKHRPWGTVSLEFP